MSWNPGVNPTNNTHESFQHPNPIKSEKNNSIKFMNWNVARDYDFAKMVILHTNDKLKDNFLNATKSALNQTGQDFRDFLIRKFISKENPNILALQEVHDGFTKVNDSSNRERIVKWLNPEKYEYYKGNNPDSIVAWDKNRFEKVDAHEGIGFTVVFLKDRTTGNIIPVASAHITGADDPVNPANDAEEGNNQVQNMMEEINAINESFHTKHGLVGMDANVVASYTPRFEPLTNLHYKADAQQEPTIKHFQRGEPRRKIPDTITALKIDHIFQRGFKKLNSPETSHIELRNPELNPSDHNYITMTLGQKSSVADKLQDVKDRFNRAKEAIQQKFSSQTQENPTTRQTQEKPAIGSHRTPRAKEAIEQKIPSPTQEKPSIGSHRPLQSDKANGPSTTTDK
jgi:hypothetical protein